MSTGVVPPLWNSVKVIVPVGLKPPSSAAVSVKVTGFAPSVTVVGLGVVLSVGLAMLTVTCSASASRCRWPALLLASPL